MKIAMKKRFIILLCITLAAVLLSGCGAQHYTDNTSFFGGETAMLRVSGTSGATAPQAAPTDMAVPMMDEAEAVMFDMDDSGMWNDGGAVGSGIEPISAPATTSPAEKIIYSLWASIETMKFDYTITEINILIDRYGAFIENSNISGANYASRHHGWNINRYADFVIRVPVENFNAFDGELSVLGNVVSRTQRADNITFQFYDTQSRLNSLQIQEERLLSMLMRADEVVDLIAIEERLGEVRMQVESFTTSLNLMQSQVSFSTITLNIWEVEEFTEITEPGRTYWERIGDGFMSTLRNIGRFFMNLFMWIIISAPVLILLIVIAGITLLIIRWKLLSIKKKKIEKNKQQTEG